LRSIGALRILMQAFRILHFQHLISGEHENAITFSATDGSQPGESAESRKNATFFSEKEAGYLFFEFTHPF